MQTIRNIVREYAGNIGDQASAGTGNEEDEAEAAEARELESQHLINLVDKFWVFAVRRLPFLRQ